jgi:hypothetical protein
MNEWGVELESFAQAKALQTADIARLREGEKRDKRLASLLAACRKKSRCNLIKCAVCEYRKQRAETRIIQEPAIKSVTLDRIANVHVTAIDVAGKRRPLNEAKVKFIAASMREIGQETPITIRMVGKKKIVLVAGLLRLAVAKLLGWESILCSTMVGDKTDARLWEISENLHRADLRVLERAESIEEWRRLIREKAKGGKLHPPAETSRKMPESRRLPKSLVSRGRKFAGRRPSREFRVRRRRQR